MNVWPAYLVLLALTLEGCVAPRKLSYTAAELRAELALRIPRENVVVPFEVAPRYVAKARQATSYYLHKSVQAKDLIRAMFAPEVFGLQYAPTVTTTAMETLESGRGNCLSLASVYVGLARSIGLTANYLDASHRFEEVKGSRALVVKTGHVTASVDFGSGEVILDLGQWYNRHSIYRIMSDLEATAHYYNNRGYEVIFQAQQGGQPVDWTRAEHDFHTATRVDPGFARAWNNLGVARARLDRPEQAKVCYLKALELDPDLDSARVNLDILRSGLQPEKTIYF